MLAAYEAGPIRLTIYSRSAGGNQQFYYKLWTKGMPSYGELPNWPVGSTIYSRDDRWYWTFASYGFASHDAAEQAGLDMLRDIQSAKRGRLSHDRS